MRVIYSIVREYVALPALLFLFCLRLSVSVMADETAAWMPGELLVKYKPGVSVVQMESMNKTLGVTSVRILEVGDNDWRAIKFNPLENVKEKAKKYLKTGLVQYVEPNYIVRTCRVPNDPVFENLDNSYRFNITGIPAAWDKITDASSVIVAVVDTGIDYKHEDIKENMWVNPHPEGGDIYGVSILNGHKTFNPMDKSGHGTHVAGIIGACGNNGKGTAGVAWKVKLMACKVLEKESGLGYVSDVVEGIVYARKHGARVVNVSLGFSYDSEILKEELKACRDAGIIVVCAAGNKTSNMDKNPHYPAGYCTNLENVLSVGCSDSEDKLTYYSNYGATSIQIFAPGHSIYSTIPGEKYEVMSGTSMSAPLITGAVALCMAAHPEEDYFQIRNRLLSNADPISCLKGKCVTGGRLNVNKMVNNSKKEISFLHIRGADQIEPGETSPYTALAVYTDGSSETVNNGWRITSGSEFGKISNSGILTGTDEGWVTIEADYKKNGTTWTASKKIAVGDTEDTPLTYYAEDGLIYTLYLKSQVAHLSDCSKDFSGSVILDESIYFAGKDYPLVTIGRSAFSRSGITSIIIPAGVKEICDNAFYACFDLACVIFEDGSQLEEIGKSAFFYCFSLRNIVIPEGVIRISEGAFRSCQNLVTVEMPKSVTSIENYAFCECDSLVTAEIPKSVTSLGDSAFDVCRSLRNAIFLGNQPEAGENVFGDTRNLSCLYFLKGKKGWEDGGTWCDKTTKMKETNAPVLQGKIEKGNLVLTFTGNLESSSDGKQWKSINATSPCAVKMNGSKKFYRSVDK